MWKTTLGIETRLLNEEFRVLLQSRLTPSVWEIIRFGWFGDRDTSFPVPDGIMSEVLWSVYLPLGYAYPHFAGTVEKEDLASGWRPIIRSSERCERIVKESSGAYSAAEATGIRANVHRWASWPSVPTRSTWAGSGWR